MGYNRPEWFLADLGAILAGGLPAGIYSTSTAEQCRYIAEHAEAAVAVVENAQLPGALPGLRGGLPAAAGDRADGRASAGRGGRRSPGRSSWRAAARSPEEDARPRIAAAEAATTAATLIYTSGTTGAPKAVMLSHDNLVWTARQVVDTLRRRAGDDDAQLPAAQPHRRAGRSRCTRRWPPAPTALVRREHREAGREPARGAAARSSSACRGCGRRCRRACRPRARRTRPLRRRIVAWARRQGLAGGYAEQRGQPAAAPLRPGAPPGVRQGARAAGPRSRAALRDLGRRRSPCDTLEFFLGPRHPDPRGLRDERVHRADDLRHCPAATAPASAGFALPGTELTHRAGRRDPDARPARLPGLLTRTRQATARPSTPRAGCTPATSATSTPRASCESPTARRSCSSPRAARTSRRRSSRRASSRSPVVAPGGGAWATGATTWPRCSPSTRVRAPTRPRARAARARDPDAACAARSSAPTSRREVETVNATARPLRDHPPLRDPAAGVHHRRPAS